MFLAQALIHGNNGSGAVLETLKLDNCGLKNNVLELLGPGIRRSNLSYLSLRNNRINHVGAIWIGVMLRDYDDMAYGTNNSPLSPTYPAFSERHEVRTEKSRQGKRGIETLDITGNDIRSGIQYIAQALRRNRSLRELHLLDNKLDPKDLTAFSEGLKHNHTLQLLDLSHNPLEGQSVDGIIAFRNALSVNKGIRALFLSGVQLSSEGAIALAEYLPETKSLIHLDLTTNPGIDVAGIMALSVSLKMNQSIRCLDVNVPPNDNEMARLSRDILRACVRNTELVQNQEGEDITFKYKTNSIPDEHGSSGSRIPVLIEDVKKDIREASENIKLLEEMMSIDQQKFLTHNVEPDEIVKQLHDQCRSFQSKVQSYITGANDEALLADLLTLNDNLLSTLQTYDSLYSHVEDDVSSEPLGIPGSSKSSISTNPTSPPRSPSPSITLPPEKPSFSFLLKDADEGSDNENFHDLLDLSDPQLQLDASTLSLDDIPRSKSPIEELNRLLEVEEGEVLRKAKSNRLVERG